MQFTQEQIIQICGQGNILKSGQKLGSSFNWQSFAKSERSLWGEIKGSGKNPYLATLDTNDLAFKCSCPSRVFPCKHAVGLMFLNANEGDKFEMQEEPPYVKEWLDKRKLKSRKIENAEVSEATSEVKSKQKSQREDNRLVNMKAGVDELLIWLSDLIRIGILELPSKPQSFFNDMAARMVDAQIPTIGNWLKSFNEIDYSKEGWQEITLTRIGKLYLLLKSFDTCSNDQVDQMLRGKMGWNFKTIELAANSETLLVKDKWLVLGGEIEVLEDGLTAYRNWLWGLSTQKEAMILNFESKFAPNSFLHLPSAHVMEAELAFYPGNLENRAFINKQNDNSEDYKILVDFAEDWREVSLKKNELLKEDPWVSNRVFLLNEVRLISQKKHLLLIDKNKRYRPVSDLMDEDKVLGLMLVANNAPCSMAVLESPKGLLPLGIFQNGHYLPI